jgi:hypothetical protein
MFLIEEKKIKIYNSFKKKTKYTSFNNNIKCSESRVYEEKEGLG